jgi:hypothetical protein
VQAGDGDSGGEQAFHRKAPGKTGTRVAQDEQGMGGNAGPACAATQTKELDPDVTGQTGSICQ